MSISGVDPAGNVFEGTPTESSTSTPQTVDVRIIPTIYEIPPGFPLYFTVRITNLGAEDTFTLALTSDKGGSVKPTTKQVRVSAKGTADVQFLYTAPANVGGNLERITLTATASSNTTIGVTNQALLELPTSTTAPIPMNAWLDGGNQGMLSHDRKYPVTVWLCNNNIDAQSVFLANDVTPIKSQILSLAHIKNKTVIVSGNKKIELPDKIQCNATSVIKLDSTLPLSWLLFLKQLD